MNKVTTHVMPEPWSDRQVILAIALTLILVLGLILGSVSFNREQQAPMLWRETPQPTAKPLAI
jgi:cell division protein FtsX